ncbi:A24 family peptidase [Agrococcus carbonis]|uniref:Leader peptidase (Prepilin peptidase) / N-methyltransferase n=1 Tax=Agrococcus carbonis TaxID=684552 RepID=A0A1H1S337_9MICO|nr:prepilin peptidase [Agrococcus carbonis]SDS42490.1 leader peptidase (prepilin peptidase) / N-methyltransferase [Agrococcus carbonis]
MPPLVIALAAVLCAVAAWLLTPWARRIAESDSRWLHRAVPAAIGAVAGAGAALIADHWAVLLALCALAIGAALLVPVDLAVFRLPDAIVWPTTGAVLGMLLVAAVATGEWARFGWALAAMLIVGVIYFALGWIAPQSFGLGDVKLSLVLGLALGWFGWRAVLWGMLGGFAVFAVVALLLVATRRVSLKSDLAFGPWMLVGAWAGLAVGAVSA